MLDFLRFILISEDLLDFIDDCEKDRSDNLSSDHLRRLLSGLAIGGSLFESERLFLLSHHTREVDGDAGGRLLKRLPGGLDGWLSGLPRAFGQRLVVLVQVL